MTDEQFKAINFVLCLIAGANIAHVLIFIYESVMRDRK